MVGSKTKPVIGLVTCAERPEPDPDEPLLLEALHARGAEAHMLAWDDPRADWAALDLAVIRSTWNYHLHHQEFLAWIDRASSLTRVLNPPEILRWNSHKNYLADLERRGIRIVPTEFLARGARASLAEIMARRGWTEVVVKPSVSGGSFDTHRTGGAGLESGERELARMLGEREVMIQPYVRSVDGFGERSMIIIDGELTHSIRKTPRFAHGVEQVSNAIAIAPEERDAALSIWAGLPAGLLYGRVDLARNDEGLPMVMELELVEPSLFLVQHPPALERFASAIFATSLASRR